MAPLHCLVIEVYLSACAFSISTGTTQFQRSQEEPKVKSRSYDTDRYASYSVADNNDVEVYKSDGIELNVNNLNAYQSNQGINNIGVYRGNEYEDEETSKDMNESNQQLPTYYSANHRYHPTTYNKDKDEHKGEVVQPPLSPDHPASAASSLYTQAVFPGNVGGDLDANQPASASSSLYTQAVFPGNVGGDLAADHPASAASSLYTQDVFSGNVGGDLVADHPASAASSLYTQAVFPDTSKDLATLGSDSGPQLALPPPPQPSGYKYNPPPLPPLPPPPTIGYDYLPPPSNEYLPATTAPPPPPPTVGYTYLRPPPSNEYLPALTQPPPPPPTVGYTYLQPPPSKEYLPAAPPMTGYSYLPPPPSNQYLPEPPEPSSTTTTPAPSTTEAEAPDAYTYYYLGTKLWYFPLFFTFYLSLYMGAIILRQWARHDQRLPQHSFDAASTSLADRRQLDVDLLADRVSKAIASYMGRHHHHSP